MEAATSTMPAHSQLPDQLPTGWPGAVYLLCFTAPFGGKRHYLGWAYDLPARLRDHYRGNGKSVPLLKAAYEAGIRFACVRWWPGDRHLEARFKYHDGSNGKPGRARKGRHGVKVNLALYCPRCVHRTKQTNVSRTISGHRLPAGWIEPSALF